MSEETVTIADTSKTSKLPNTNKQLASQQALWHV